MSIKIGKRKEVTIRKLFFCVTATPNSNYTEEHPRTSIGISTIFAKTSKDAKDLILKNLLNKSAFIEVIEIPEEAKLPTHMLMTIKLGVTLPLLSVSVIPNIVILLDLLEGKTTKYFLKKHNAVLLGTDYLTAKSIKGKWIVKIETINN